MRTYERSNVTVDQCTECRGIFLDRGELERLVDAEAAWAGAPQAPVPPPQQQPPPPPPQQQYGHSRDYREQQYQQYPPRKRRKSFFEELFD
jgi:uncharacterized protein